MKATGIVFILGRARTNKLGQGSKEVGMYVPADVDDEDKTIPCMAMMMPGKVMRPRPMAMHSEGLNWQSGWHIQAGNGNGNDIAIAMMTPGMVTRAHSAGQPE